MRIIAGKFRGRKLVNCEHLKSLRPTTDRNREALFNILQSPNLLSKINPCNIIQSRSILENCVFMDICCGTGAVGLEAISRGAQKVIFIENNYRHLEILQKNIQLLSNYTTSNQFEVINQDASRISGYLESVDIIFIDPPYEQDYQRIIDNLIDKNYLVSGKNQLSKESRNHHKTLLIIEFNENCVKKYQDYLQQKFITIDQRKYGKSVFGFFVVKD